MKTAYCLIFLFFSLFAATLPLDAQSAFDSEDDELTFEDGTEDTFETETVENRPTGIDRFLDDATITFGYLFSYGLDSPSDIIDHTAYTRVEYQTLAAENLFFKFDGKADFHFKNDHIADAKNEALFFDGTVREIYLQKGFNRVSLTAGKQVVVWGKADAAVVTDVVSPRDMSRFLFIDLEDSRMGQWMVSLNTYSDIVNGFFFITPLPQTDNAPNTASRYHRDLPGGSLYTVKADQPESGDLEYGFRLSGTVSKTDFSLMAGHLFSNSTVYHTTGDFEDGKPVLKETFPEYDMIGAAVTHTWNQFLFKLEAAYKFDFPLQGLTAGSLYTGRARDIADAAAGIEFNDNDKYRLNIELSNRYIPAGKSGLFPGTDEISSALYTTFSTDFLNQTLNFEYTFYHHIQEKNQFHQIHLSYDVSDELTLLAKAAFFNLRDQNSLMWSYRNEDRVEFEVRYYF